jgi:hypothetical protein
MLEPELRELVASHLPLLEPGLTLVATEYPLPNAAGTRGRIDILARDRLGHFVVVEIKRSNSAAREAVHEIYKYVELLRAERGLRPADLRCMLVSTEWTELMRPFSAFVRSFEYDCRGFSPEFDQDGHLRCFTSVTPLPEPLIRGFTGEQLGYLFSYAPARDAAFDAIAAALAEVGCYDHVGICLNHLNPKAVAFPYLLYMALGAIDERDPATSVLAEWENDPYSPWQLESRALYYASERTRGQIGVEELEYSNAERFGDLVKDGSGWSVSDIRRAGAFFDQRDLVSDKEITEQLHGRQTSNAVSYERRASPSIHPSWDEFRAEVRRFLKSAPLWRDGLDWWLDNAEREVVQEVVVWIFCPHDLPLALKQGAERGETLRRIPALGAASYLAPDGGTPGDGTEHRLLFGELQWDGTTSPSSFEAFTKTYGEATYWALFPHPETDNDFLELLGIGYALLHKAADGRRLLLSRRGQSFVGKAHDDVLIDGGDIHLVWTGHQRMDAFLADRAQDLGELVKYLQRHQISVTVSGS